MANFGSKETIITSIQSHFSHLNAGEISAEEMNELVDLTRELHDRMVILRYKSYEQQVFGVQNKETDIAQHSFSTEVSTTEFVSESNVETIVETDEPELEEEKTPENPIFDFNLFDENPAESTSEKPTEFDLFGSGSEEELIAEKVETNDFEAVQESSNQIEEESIVPEVNIEKPVETPVEQQTTPTEITEDADRFFSKIPSLEDSMGSRMMIPKLSSLVGSFGFNEKLQCISELFGDSSEAFNSAIQQLDIQSDFAAAKSLMQTIAKENHWDLEKEITIEFVQKVERRFL
jgi:hypothetical protein